MHRVRSTRGLSCVWQETYPDDLGAQFVVIGIGFLVEAIAFRVLPVDASPDQMLFGQCQPQL